MTKLGLLAILFAFPLPFYAQGKPQKGQAIPQGPSVGVRIPSGSQSVPSLTTPQRGAVEGPVPNWWEAGMHQGELASNVRVHDVFIKDLQAKVSDLMRTKTVIYSGAIVALSLLAILFGIPGLRKSIVRNLVVEAFPSIERFLPSHRTKD